MTARQIIGIARERAEQGFGKPESSDVVVHLWVYADAGTARAMVAEVLACPVSEIDVGSVLEVNP